MPNEIKKIWNFLVSPGRLSRREIWLKYFLPYTALIVSARVVDHVLVAQAGAVSGALAFLLFWPSIAVGIRRFHDRGMSAWWVVWFGLPMFVGFVIAWLGTQEAEWLMADTQRLRQHSPEGPLLMIAAGKIWVIVVAMPAFVIQYFLPGQKGENRFGPDPLESRT